MLTTRTPSGRLLVALFALGAIGGAIAPPGANADDAQPKATPAPRSTPSAAFPRSPEQVMVSLNRAMAWYR